MTDYTEKHLLGADMDHDEQCVDQARQLISSGFMEEERLVLSSCFFVERTRRTAEDYVNSRALV